MHGDCSDILRVARAEALDAAASGEEANEAGDGAAVFDSAAAIWHDDHILLRNSSCHGLLSLAWCWSHEWLLVCHLFLNDLLIINYKNAAENQRYFLEKFN